MGFSSVPRLANASSSKHNTITLYMWSIELMDEISSLPKFNINQYYFTLFSEQQNQYEFQWNSCLSSIYVAVASLAADTTAPHDSTQQKTSSEHKLIVLLLRSLPYPFPLPFWLNDECQSHFPHFATDIPNHGMDVGWKCYYCTMYIVSQSFIMSSVIVHEWQVWIVIAEPIQLFAPTIFRSFSYII